MTAAVKPLRVAIAGAGFFSRFQIEGWKAIAGVEIVGIANRHLDKADAAARRYGIGRTFDSVEAMLDATAPDLLDIITPPPTHRAYVGMAVARGIPTICQKPFGVSYDDAVAMVEAAERVGVPLVVHENFRFEPWYREARRLVEEGRFGTLHAIGFRMRPGDGQGPRAYLDRQPYFQAMPRFLVVETAIHFIDTFRYLMGEAEAITARLRRMNPAVAGEDAGYLLFEFAGGATGLLDANRCNDQRRRAPVVEGAPRPGSTARLRSRSRRHVRRGRVRTAATARHRSPRTRHATGKCRARLPRQPARAGGGLCITPRRKARRAVRLRAAEGSRIPAPCLDGRDAETRPVAAGPHLRRHP